MKFKQTTLTTAIVFALSLNACAAPDKKDAEAFVTAE